MSTPLYLSLPTYAGFLIRAAWLRQHYQLAPCSFNKLLYRPHSTTAMLRLWNQDLTHRYEALPLGLNLFLHLTIYALQYLKSSNENDKTKREREREKSKVLKLLLSTYVIKNVQTDDILILTLTGFAITRCNTDCK